VPTKPITITHSGPDTVCHHSGLTPESCDYCCANCKLSCVLVADRAEIARRAEAIRDQWPAWRREQCELRVELEIPQAIKITDHMRRNPKHET
jgi:hypothetical protein